MCRSERSGSFPDCGGRLSKRHRHKSTQHWGETAPTFLWRTSKDMKQWSYQHKPNNIQMDETALSIKALECVCHCRHWESHDDVKPINIISVFFIKVCSIPNKKERFLLLFFGKCIIDYHVNQTGVWSGFYARVSHRFRSVHNMTVDTSSKVKRYGTTQKIRRHFEIEIT